MCLLLLIIGLTQSVRAATIQGTVVADHSGSPVASASVRMYRTGQRGLAADLETGGEGRFHAPELQFIAFLTYRRLVARRSAAWHCETSFATPA